MNLSAYGKPILISGKNQQALAMQPIELQSDESFQYNEDWLQKTIAAHPELLPIEEIDPIFGDLIPVCRELSTPVGALDNLFINDQGMLTLVECKLWRNPEARRKVVGQILDYAQEFSRLDFDELNRLIGRKTGRNGNVLFDIAADHVEGLNEKKFTDAVMKNLRRGRFLLLIVGDGIRERVEQIGDYLQRHAHLNFTFALVEQSLFRISRSDCEDVLIQPRILAKTTVIERGIVRLESDSIKFEEAPQMAISESTARTSSPRRGNLTEQTFFEHIEENFPTLKDKLSALFKELEEIDVRMDWASSGVGAKNGANSFNFLFFEKTGKIRNYGCGGTPLGREYLEKLAALFENAQIRVNDAPFQATLAKPDGSLFTANDLLQRKTQWIQLVESFQAKFQEN